MTLKLVLLRFVSFMLNPSTQKTQHSHAAVTHLEKSILQHYWGHFGQSFFPTLFSQQWQLWCSPRNPCDILILPYRFQTLAFILELSAWIQRWTAGGHFNKRKHSQRKKQCMEGNLGIVNIVNLMAVFKITRKRADVETSVMFSIEVLTKKSTWIRKKTVHLGPSTKKNMHPLSVDSFMHQPLFSFTVLWAPSKQGPWDCSPFIHSTRTREEHIYICLQKSVFSHFALILKTKVWSHMNKEKLGFEKNFIIDNYRNYWISHLCTLNSMTLHLSVGWLFFFNCVSDIYSYQSGFPKKKSSIIFFV